MVAASEININEGASATQMANAIFGDGVTVTSASYSGWSQSSGIYTGGDTTSPGVVPGDTGVILSTGRASHFTNSNGQSNQSTNTSTNTPGQSNNAQFNAAAGTNTYDASYLDINFIPTGDTMTMQFVFSSEEYPEYVNSLYQDFVGVWVNGSLVEMSVGNGDTDPGNINSGDNENLYVDNTSDQYNTEMDGFTVTLTLTMDVNPGVVNSIRIGIADVADSSYDSNLLIAGDSIQTVLIANDDDVALLGNQTKTIDVLANDDNSQNSTLTITHINGIAVTAGSTVTLNTGQTVLLNANGTITLTGDGTDEDFNFTYTIDNGLNTDTGYVLVEAVPCFVAGTRIRTPRGDVLVEHLQPGDMVLTEDHGARPLRWIGNRTVAAEGKFAPVHIAAGALGNHEALTVSPQHRILMRDPVAELLFGNTEVLVAAKHLVNGDSVTLIEGGEVTYFHLLFDQHQIIYGNGIASESFLPGPRTSNMFEAEVLEEICALFPEFNPETGDGYGRPARLPLKDYETQAFMRTAA